MTAWSVSTSKICGCTGSLRYAYPLLLLIEKHDGSLSRDDFPGNPNHWNPNYTKIFRAADFADSVDRNGDRALTLSALIAWRKAVEVDTLANPEAAYGEKGMLR